MAKPNYDDTKRENYSLTVTRAQRALLIKMLDGASAKSLQANPNLIRALKRNVEGAKLIETPVEAEVETGESA